MRKPFNISIRGTPPFGMLARHLALDDSFKEDARVILELPHNQFDAFSTALKEYESFLSRQVVDQIAADHLEGFPSITKITNATWRVAELLRDSDVSIEESLSILDTTLAGHLEGFDHDEREELFRRIKELCALPRGFDLQSKADHLSQATGMELEQFQIVCDIRPVFNSDRTKIEGALPVTLMRLDIDDDGFLNSIEVRLTSDQIRDLEEKVVSARKKITAINEWLESFAINVPYLSE